MDISNKDNFMRNVLSSVLKDQLDKNCTIIDPKISEFYCKQRKAGLKNHTKKESDLVIQLTTLVFCYPCNSVNDTDRESLISLGFKKEPKNFEIDGDTFTVVVREEYRIDLYCGYSSLMLEQTSCGQLVSRLYDCM